MSEYASAKTHAVIPEPHVNTTFSLLLTPIDLNFSSRVFLFKNVLSELMHSAKGRQTESFIDPVFTLDLGSGASPRNLFLLLASINLNSFLFMFSSIFIFTNFIVIV